MHGPYYAPNGGGPPQRDYNYHDYGQDYSQQRSYPRSGYEHTDQPDDREGGQWRPRGGYDGYGGHGGNRHGGNRRGGRWRKGIIITSVVLAVALVAAGGFIVLRPRRGKNSGFVPTAGSPSGDAEQLAAVFLSAWEKGDLPKAAGYTDDPAAALTTLQAYKKDLHLRSLTASVQSAVATSAPRAPASSRAAGKGGGRPASPPAVVAAKTAEQVAFQIGATVAASSSPGALSGKWAYRSSLVAFQAADSANWYIEWQPDVIAPNLTSGQHLAAVSVPATVNQVTDSAGTPLTSYGDAGLSYISTLIEQDGTSGEHGKAGLYVQIENAAGKPLPNSQAVVVAPQSIGSLATTIQPGAEDAARSAVMQKPDSSMVVIQPSTGNILAIANNDGYNNFALTARVAPGSTMKIVTTTALYTLGLATDNSPVVCPKAYTVQGVTIHNDAGMSEPPSTPLLYDFAVSCNDAFTQWWQKLSAPSGSDSNLLAATGKKYYGLDEQWDIGIAGQSAEYFDAPPSASGSELAEEDFGEGRLETCPLAMASIAATVESGTFRQPVLVPGTKRITATPIPSSVDSELHAEMRAVVTEGTAAGEGFGPNVYAKTGTADINGQQQPNSWFVAFDPNKDIAVAALDLNAGYGAQYAAPEVRSFISQYSG
jgi:hypothetical protein